MSYTHDEIQMLIAQEQSRHWPQTCTGRGGKPTFVMPGMRIFTPKPGVRKPGPKCPTIAGPGGRSVRQSTSKAQWQEMGRRRRGQKS